MGFSTDEFPFTSEYDSDLRAVLKYVRKVEALVASYDEIIAELRQELANIQGLYTRVDALERATADLAEIRTNITNLQTGLTGLINKEEADIDNLQRQIDNFKDTTDKLARDIEDVRSYVDYKVASVALDMRKRLAALESELSKIKVDLEEKIDYINWRLDQIDTSVINPWHTTEGRITQDRNAKHIYADLADECLTAEEYCKLGLNARDYSNFGITARQYAKAGKKHLHFRWVYSPVFGWRQDINVVLTSIMNACRHTLTARRYRELGLTAKDYSELNLSAFEYYSYNPERMGIYVDNGVLHSDQYWLQVVDGVLEFVGVESSVDDGVLQFE